MGVDGCEKSTRGLAEGGGYETLEMYVFLDVLFDTKLTRYGSDAGNPARYVLGDILNCTYANPNGTCSIKYVHAKHITGAE